MGGSGTTANPHRIKRELRSRSGVEAVIGQIKAEGHLNHYYRKELAGDAANAILTVVGCNLRLVWSG